MPRCLSLLALALAGLAHAAPAPFQKATDLPEVQLSGMLPDERLVAGAPQVIVSQADYQSVAKAWGIASPPKVDFRTHFLFVTVSTSYGSAVGYELDGSGNLRTVVTRVPMKCKCGLSEAGFGFQIKSFHRSAVKTVNGTPLPRK